jgi:hypothetical protein
MADYSRDTYKLTNVMHQMLTGETVTNPRHYVGVRLQQGVPILDADWNELEDIRRIDTQINLRHYFGDGIPSGNSGFQVGPVTIENDFSINGGMALVSGKMVFNEERDLTYLEQETKLGVTVDTLTPPPSGERNDLVYLDVWEEDLGASGGDRADERLANPAIGLETCRRIERRWVVRLEVGAADISAVTNENGHVYMALARITRCAGQQRIFSTDIYDLRRIDINVAKYLKIPVYVERGGTSVDSDKLAVLLESLRNIFITRLESERLYINLVTDLAKTMVHFSVQHLIQICGTGTLQAQTNNLTNTDALQVLTLLVQAQQEFLNTLTTYGMGGAAMTDFIGDYQNYLTGGSGIDGVQSFLDDDDLIGAYLEQQELNAWLSADVGTLPEGSVNLQFVDIDPKEDLVGGTTYTVYVKIVSGVTSDQDDEIFDVTASLTSDLWQLSPTSREITLDNVTGPANTGVVKFDVTPSSANLTCDLLVVATSRRNPTIKTPQPALELEIGETPLTGGVLQYAGPPLNTQGRMELSAADLTSGFGTSVGFAFNNNDSITHEYFVDWFIALSIGDETGWSPLSGSTASNSVSVSAGDTGGLALNISGPAGGSVVGNIGTLTVTLIQIDTDVLTEEQQEVVTVEFEAV